jgi:hypothetical protein
MFGGHGDGITDVIGGPHDFLPPRSDEFQKLCYWLVPGFSGITPKSNKNWFLLPFLGLIWIISKEINNLMALVIECYGEFFSGITPL